MAPYASALGPRGGPTGAEGRPGDAGQALRARGIFFAGSLFLLAVLFARLRAVVVLRAAVAATALPAAALRGVALTGSASLIRSAPRISRRNLPVWLAAGPSAVVITHGGDGLTAYTRNGAEHSVPGEKVDVVDTIGAGDTVNAALLHGLAAQDALSPEGLAALDAAGWQRLLRFAARAAAVTCSRAGAQPPYAAEVGEP